MELKPRCGTMVEAVLALEGCSRYGARFISSSGEATFYPYEKFLERAKSVAGTLQAEGLKPGDRVAILLTTSIHFLDVFVGVQLAGGIPAALYPPLQLGKLPEYLSRTQGMMSQIGTRFLITESRIKKILGLAAEGVSSLERVFEAPHLLTGAPYRPVPVDPDAPAFLQFSSGTTAQPKAVMVSHTNLLYNLEMMDDLFRAYDEDQAAERGGVCWLPLYHDMGLVGFLFLGLYHPGTVTYIGPEVFIANPAIWLQTISRYKAVISAAPSFAYEFCLARIKDEAMAGVDLSSWIITLNGAEVVDVDVMARFTERFRQWGFRPEALTPAYGLAEAGLAVTFSDIQSVPVVTEFDRDLLSEQGVAEPGAGRRLPSLGRPMACLDVEVRDEEGRRLADGKVGRIFIHGPSVTKGYYNAPEATSKVLNDGWLDTGDLGFFHEGNLYISGRLKDLIIIRGRNYAPQEIESLAAGVEGVRPACVAAVGHAPEGMGEQLIILAERNPQSQRPAAEVEAEIKQRVLSGIGLTAYHVQLLEAGTLPRTASAKIRRAEALRQFLAGELVAPEEMGPFKLLREVGKSALAWNRMRRRTKPIAP